MALEYDIIEVFEVTGRGAVVPIEETTDRRMGTPHKVQVLTPTGDVLEAEAYKEYMLLRTSPTALEKECYVLNGLRKGDVPDGSRLRFLE